MDIDRFEHILADHKLWAESLGAKGTKADLIGCVSCKPCRIDDVNLFAAELGDYKLSHFVMQNANFASAYLEEAKFIKTHLQNSDFRNANLRAASFNRANAENAVFISAFAEGTNFAGANLKNADFSFCDIENADFSFCDLENANFAGARNVSRAKFHQANLENVIFDAKHCETIQLLKYKENKNGVQPV